MRGVSWVALPLASGSMSATHTGIRFRKQGCSMGQHKHHHQLQQQLRLEKETEMRMVEGLCCFSSPQDRDAFLVITVPSTCIWTSAALLWEPLWRFASLTAPDVSQDSCCIRVTAKVWISDFDGCYPGCLTPQITLQSMHLSLATPNLLYLSLWTTKPFDCFNCVKVLSQMLKSGCKS